MTSFIGMEGVYACSLEFIYRICQFFSSVFLSQQISEEYFQS